MNQYGAEVVPTIFESVSLTDEGYAFITVRDDSDETYIGYFKIPDRFSEQKTTRPVTVYLDGVELFFDSEPMMVNERTMVPMRKIFETLGLAVDWDDSTRTVAVSGGGKTLRLTIGNRTAYVDGVGIRLDAAPFIQDDITFVPLRFVSENSGAVVAWDDTLRRVIITRP
ncbi:MAG: copper amine oxidase N-terminal domain-containing protein [Syntrophomonadaceae bacterium]|nr:copper amine oxidase N-terminal domain-containing protein [Syntrophomonadaceae bacterium]